MIVPSIDLMDGQTVQLRGGKEKVLEAGDPLPLARRFGLVGELAVVDLDAALGQGDNTALIEQVLRATPAPVRVGLHRRPGRQGVRVPERVAHVRLGPGWDRGQREPRRLQRPLFHISTLIQYTCIYVYLYNCFTPSAKVYACRRAPRCPRTPPYVTYPYTYQYRHI